MSRSQLTSTDQQNSGGPVAPFVAGKNLLINGQFNVWQRGTSFASPTYTADRWRGPGNAGRTITQQTGGPEGSTYYLRSQRDSGNTSTAATGIAQALESIQSKPYAGKTVTLSFWARAGANYSASSNSLTVDIVTGTGTDQTPWASWTGAALAVDTGVTLTTSWQKFSVTGTLSASANQVGILCIQYPTGTAGAADYVDFADFQLEAGSVATPFTTATGTLSGELALCQRYYWRTPQPVGSSDRISVFGTCTSTTEQRVVVQHPVPMRLAPTTIDYASLRAYDGAGFPTVTSIAITSTTPLYSEVVSVGTGLTAYRPTAYAVTATTGYFGFTAEL